MTHKILRDGEVVDAEEGFAEQALIDSAAAQVAAPRIPQVVAVASLQIADGMVNGIETAVGLSLALAIDVGVYWVFFTEPQPNTSYIWNVGSSSGTINVSMRDESMMQLTALDGGVPTDPSEISIQVFRVI